MSIRVLVVDDSVVFRKGISDALSDDPSISVIGTAPNGKIIAHGFLLLGNAESLNRR